jgi:hypothetical protein
VILQIDVTVTAPDGSTASGSAAVDVTEPVAADLERGNPNEAMRQRSRALRYGVSRA